MNKLTSTLILIFLLLLVLALYTLIHEGGHALVGLLFGGTITSFSANFFDLSAHVGIDGKFSLAQHALISIAGVALPVLLCMGFILLSSQKDNLILTWFKTLLFLSAINALLAWMAVPVFVMFGYSIGDDSVNFLNYTHIHPLLVSGMALLIYGVCWALFLHRMGGFRMLAAKVRDTSFNLTGPATRHTLLSLAAVGVVILGISFSLSQALPDRTLNAPAGYQLVAEMDLSQNSLPDQVLYQFTLEEPAEVSFYITLENVKGAPTALRISGPDGYKQTFLNMTDHKSEITRASVHPHGLILTKGHYEIRGTFQPSSGWVKVFSSERKNKPE